MKPPKSLKTKISTFLARCLMCAFQLRWKLMAPMQFIQTRTTQPGKKKTMQKAQRTQGIEYFDSFNTFSLKQKLQQGLKSWSNFSLVLFGKGGYLENFDKSTYGCIHTYPYMVSVLRVRKSNFHCLSSLQTGHFRCRKRKSEACSEIRSVTW